MKEDSNATVPCEYPESNNPVFTFSDKGNFTLSIYDNEKGEWHYLKSLPDIYDLKKYNRKGSEPLAWWDLEIPPSAQITMNLISKDFISKVFELYFLIFWVFRIRD